jgi:hypothetical protein
MQQAGDNQVRIVVWLQALGQHSPVENAPPNESDEEGVLDVVIEGIALAEAFQGHPCGAAEPFGLVLM